jgi:hypothetical protein
MAQVRLKTHECARGYLPLVCVRCGQLADGLRPFHFSRIPPWMYLVFVAGLFPCLLVAVRVHLAVLTSALLWVIGVFVLRRSANVDLPVCPKHRRRFGFNAVLLLALVPLVILLIIAVISVPLFLSQRGVVVGGYGFCILPVMLLVLLGIVVSVSRGGLRPAAISDTGVTIKGVHENFADIVRELRDAKYDE